MSLPTIRRATLSDFPALLALYREVDSLHASGMPHVFREAEPSRSDNYFDGLLADANTAVLVAEKEGGVLGVLTVSLRPAPDIPMFVPRLVAHVSEVVVHAASRRAGVGRALMQAAHEWAREAGAAEVRLTVWEFNQDALRFYEALGYRTATRGMSLTLEDQPLAHDTPGSPLPAGEGPGAMSARPMRVVLLSKAYVVAAYRRKAEELAARGVDLTLVAPPSWRDERGVMAFEPGEARGYRLEMLPIALNGNFHLHWNRGLGRLIRRLRPDIVHVEEEPYNLATVLAVRAARSVGAAVAFFTWQNLNRNYPPPFRWFERYVYRASSYALCGNRDAEDVLRAKGYSGPAAVIPQVGVDPERYTPREHEPATFTIGYAGRLVREKGADLLLRAAAGLDGDWRLILLGGGPERQALEALAGSLGIAARVQFIPWMPSADFADHLRQLSVLVVPSRSLANWKEQFGRVLVEAMACGVPVVGSTCGEIPNVIGDAGLVFPEGDEAGLAGCLARLQQDAPLRAALSEVGRRRMLERFTQAEVASATLAVYERILALRAGEGRSRSAQ